MCDLFMFKIVIVGDMGVGKSALLSRFSEDSFPMDYKPTEIVNSAVCATKVMGKPGFLQLWDASGDRLYRVALRKLFADAHGFIIVYDTTSLSSFCNVDSWLKELADFGPKEVNIMLVGTKCDEQEKRQVTQETVSNYAEQHGLSFMEASPKSGANVKDVFNTLAFDMRHRIGPSTLIG